MLGRLEALAAGRDEFAPTLEQLPKSLLALPTSEAELATVTDDARLGVRGYLLPRTTLARQMWYERATLAAASTHLPLVRAAAAAIRGDYAQLRRRLVGMHAEGLGRMSRVQRTIFVGMFTSALVAVAVERIVADSVQANSAPLMVLSAADFDYPRIMEQAADAPVAILGTTPLKDYSFKALHTAISAMVRMLALHGVPRTRDVDMLASARDYWAALWMRVAQIVGAGDLTPAESASPGFLSATDATEVASLGADARPRHGRLMRPLPLVAGGRRLRLAALERLEIVSWAYGRIFDAMAAFEAAASAPAAKGAAAEVRRRLLAVPGDPIERRWRTLLDRMHSRMGETVTRYNREELNHLVERAHVFPGENELYYAQALDRDPTTPAYTASAPRANDVIAATRSDDLDLIGNVFDKPGVHARVCRIYLDADRDYVAAPDMERAGVAWIAIALEADILYSANLPGTHLVPSNAIYIAELEQYQTTGFRPPPAGPREALEACCRRTQTAERPAGLKATLVCLARRSYVVVPGGGGSVLTLDVSDPEGPGTTPHDRFAALTTWLAFAEPLYYNLEHAIPLELRDHVAALRSR